MKFVFNTLYFLVFLIATNTSAQSDYEYVGALKLNDTVVVNYKIEFTEVEGLIKGYSLTDIGGEHETKSFIAGYFDDEKNHLNFYESGILYTKSPVTQNDFCFIHFDGKLRKMNESQQIKGSFKGLYNDGQECMSGEVILTNFNKILKRTAKMDRKIDRSVFVSKEKKEKINLTKMLDSLSLNVIRKDEVMSVFSKNKTVSLTVYDVGQEDGDKISIQVNGRFILKDYSVSNTKETLTVDLEGDKTVFKVTALNNGNVGGNTVKVDFTDASNTIETLVNLKARESVQFVFLKQN